jgi:hypothetical protein
MRSIASDVEAGMSLGSVRVRSSGRLFQPGIGAEDVAGIHRPCRASPIAYRSGSRLLPHRSDQVSSVADDQQLLRGIRVDRCTSQKVVDDDVVSLRTQVEEGEGAAELGRDGIGIGCGNAFCELIGPSDSLGPGGIERNRHSTEQNNLIPVDVPVRADLSLFGKCLPGKEIEAPVFAVPAEILVGLERELGHVVARAFGHISPSHGASEAARKQNECQHTGVVPLVVLRGGGMYVRRPHSRP